MAIFRPGPTIGAISGTLGGANFVQSRSGPVVRRALLRRNACTENQLLRRNRFGIITREWGRLTEEQRDAWRASAKLLVSSNRLGVKRNISGFQFFVKFNIQRNLYFGFASIPPNTLITHPLPVDVTIVATTTPLLELNFLPVVIDTSMRIDVQASRSFKNSPRLHYGGWKFLKSQSFGASPSTITLTSEFEAVFGPMVLDEYIALRWRAGQCFTLYSTWVELPARTTAP